MPTAITQTTLEKPVSVTESPTDPDTWEEADDKIDLAIDRINQIVPQLGANPAGSSASVAARLDAHDTTASVHGFDATGNAPAQAHDNTKHTTAYLAATHADATGTNVHGLGTASIKNTGTSGNTVPLLDGANTWSAAQTYQAAVVSTPATPFYARTANFRANSGGGNSVIFGHFNTEFTCALGANDANGQPFISFYCYHGVTNNTLRRASGTYLPSAFYVDTAGLLEYKTAPAGTVDADISNFTTKWAISNTGNIVLGEQAALATNATNGFTYIPTCAGAPTGVPTAFTGKIALVFDTTNNNLYVYDGGWLKVGMAA